MTDVAQYISRIEANLATGDSTEHTHRPALKILVESLRPAVIAINEPRRSDCGAPDFSVKRNGLTIGYIEAKDIGKSLDEAERSEQLKRYGALGNLVLTDYVEFRWIVDGRRRLAARLGVPGRHGRVEREREGEEAVVALLRNFMDREPEPIVTPRELAERMARLTHEIRALISTAFSRDMASPLLKDLRQSFASTLLPDLNDPKNTGEFADMYAQTLAYGLFAARCNHPGPPGSFRRLGAAAEIPKTNPFLRRLFETITGNALDDEPYAGYVDDLVEVLSHTDIAAILAEFGRRTRQEDPVVHFYETFLSAYDPKLREMRGVYYTPEPVVSYIVRSVDHVLRSRFGLAGGLADTSRVRYEHRENGKPPREVEIPKVLILDPACGTGTFLYAVVDRIRERFKSERNAGAWSAFVKEQLLPRLFGFELLMAPYAVAHLKLGMQLAGMDLSEAQRKIWSYDFSSDERLNVYLTNTLEEAEGRVETLIGPLRVISEEANAAASIKSEMPILVVMGNPPYSNFGRMNRNPWILGLLEDYKKDLNEKKLNLDDDFIKFVRWGQWRIERTGAGILALITNNTYIDGITHRRMRRSLLETFSDIYVLDLHGSSKRKEKAPDGSKDENVFDIQQGVAITILVKQPRKRGMAKVHHAEMWGTRDRKYQSLLATDLASTQWTRLHPNGDYAFFVPKDFDLKPEYFQGFGLKQIFIVAHNGVKTDRDSLFYDFSKQTLEKRMKTFYSEEGMAPVFREEYGVHDSSSYALLRRRSETAFDPRNIRPCLYRPFDKRFLYYSPDLTSRPAWEVMRHTIHGDNLGLVFMRQVALQEPYSHFFASRVLVDNRAFYSNKGIMSYAPVYLHPDPIGNGDLFSNGTRRHANLKPDFIADVERRLKLKFVADGKGDLKKTVGPEDVFSYLYAIFHSPTYRERYAEFLKIDFPRAPITSDRDLFRELCALGAELAALHLLESDALNRPMTSFPEADGGRVDKSHPTYLPPGDPEPGTGRQLEKGRVYINKSQYFDGVPPDVWQYHVGGYQVCDKWLKDRRGRQLSYGEINEYCKITLAISETLRLVRQIDDAIPRWPIE